VVFIEWEVLYGQSLNLVFTLLFDWMSLIFMFVVMFISSIIIMYRHSYMSHDKNLNRFIVLVYLFVVSIALIIISPNIVRILLGWDGLGLISYVLVVYYQNVRSANAGMITVLSNRLGDVAILITISWMRNYGRWDFFYFQEIFKFLDLQFIMMLILLAGITKRAQIPFSAWLPAAIAAPTPVSSLVHSSTLVTAGVYLLIRFNELLGISNFLLLISVTTLFISGLGANFEFDLKKIIALSTLRQLGIIMITLSLGLWELAYFHLIRHALFKSLLFLCAGFYIHLSSDSQDIRFIGKLVHSYPLVNVYFIGCSLSLCGFPFLAGFYSRDLILERYFFSTMNFIIYLLLFIGTLLTITYSIRLLFYVFVNIASKISLKSYSVDVFMLLPMRILFLISILVGASFRWLFISQIALVLPLIIKFSILLLGSILVNLIYLYFNKTSQFLFSTKINLVKLLWFVGIIWYLPFLTHKNPLHLLRLSKLYHKYLDMGWLEKMGGQGGMSHLMSISTFIEKWHYAHMKTYIYVMIVCFIVTIVII